MLSINKGRVATWLKRFGLYRPVVTLKGYHGRFQFWMADEIGSVAIRDAEAEFWIGSPNEFNTLENLPEEEVITDVIDSLRPDDVFYDIGANIGIYACLAASIVEPDVIAFDPEPRNAARLEENAALNDAAVDVYEYALSDTAETREFGVTYFDGACQTGPAGHSFVTGDEQTDEIITVEAVLGDEFIDERSLPKPTVVKIDVEGAEWAVVTGLEETLSHPECRLVYCEAHEDQLRSQGVSVADLIEKLEGMGFDVEVPFTPYGEPFLRGTKANAGES